MLTATLSFALAAFAAAHLSPNPVIAPMPIAKAEAKIDLELKLDASKLVLAITISSRDGQEFSFSPAWLAASNVTVQTSGGPVTLEGAGDGPAVTLPGGAQIYREIDLGAHRAAIETGAEIRWKSGAIELGPLRSGRILPTAAGPNGSEEEARAFFGKMTNQELSQYTVLLRTTMGDMKAEFYPDKAPNHVKNYLALSLSGFYKGKIFHRVIKGFMVQGGCPQGSGMGSHGPRVNLETSDLKHDRGVLSMARTNDPNSATCQFFVVHQPSTHLDKQYSAFGKLISGFDVLDKIATTPVGAQDRPITEVKILDVIVESKGQQAATKVSN
jgi:peptidyl-prolyl cis-trans isomerase B (cyclophilin B)